MGQWVGLLGGELEDRRALLGLGCTWQERTGRGLERRRAIRRASHRRRQRRCAWLALGAGRRRMVSQAMRSRRMGLEGRLDRGVPGGRDLARGCPMGDPLDRVGKVELALRRMAGPVEERRPVALEAPALPEAQGLPVEAGERAEARAPALLAEGLGPAEAEEAPRGAAPEEEAAAARGGPEEEAGAVGPLEGPLARLRVLDSFRIRSQETRTTCGSSWIRRSGRCACLWTCRMRPRRARQRCCKP